MLALVEQEPKRLPTSTAQLFMKVQLKRPAGCAADRHCVGPNGYSDIYYSEAARGYDSYLDYAPLRYPAGRYTAYLLTNPGSKATAVIKASGAKPGTARVRAAIGVPASAHLSSDRGDLSTVLGARADFRLRGPGFTLNRMWSMDDTAAAIGTGELELCTAPSDPEDQGLFPPQDSNTCIAGGGTLGLSSPRSRSTTCDGGPGLDASPSAPRDFDCGSSGYLSRGWYSVFMDGHRSGLRPVIGSISVAFEFLRL